MKKYNIMTSCDDHLVNYLAVGLTAMSYHLNDAEIDFFFLHSKVSRQNINMLTELCIELSKEHGLIHFHEIFVPNAEVYDNLAKYGGSWAGEAYYSLCAHLLLPDEVDRVLYLDAGDTLIIGDIDPYYHYDFQGKSLIVTGSQYKIKHNELVLFDSNDLNKQNEYLPRILRGIFNSGSYLMNLTQMRKDERSLFDYQYLSEMLQNLFGKDNHNIYWGDQGLLSAAFAGDVRYYAFPEIRDLWYMPYNFCLWYYDRKNQAGDRKLFYLPTSHTAVRFYHLNMVSLDSLTDRSVYGGSLVFTDFQVQLYKCWITPFAKFCIIQGKPYHSMLGIHFYDECSLRTKKHPHQVLIFIMSFAGNNP